MTEQERAEYRARMRAATSEQERDQIRLEHHARMQQRAEEKGLHIAGGAASAGRSETRWRTGSGPWVQDVAA